MRPVLAQRGWPKPAADHAKHATSRDRCQRVRRVAIPPNEPVMEDKPKSANPNRLTPEDLATLLSNRRKKRVELEHIQADIEAGAPTNADGTLSVVAYAAWLLQEKHRGD
ncbi:hypothetical protein SV7mr_31510 [Stieleria bergensis]|uniref:Uncharacterized protein n=2 Tax=Stieleria bergensis TaxID=2528025 RepID=A0A517SWW4_9BACT|nr:hypothetical protein SV7mr_31510 [Planctomycetes bacterium SV_7m_r]